jgi:uncharacterized membrane protein
MRSKFAIYGHPLHTIIVGWAIGLLIWTLIGDIVYVATAHAMFWHDMALWTGIAGICTALSAALPGFGDYLTIGLHSDARGIATAHMLMNLAVVAMFAVAAFMMTSADSVAGTTLAVIIVLHALGVGLLGASGYLGGEMVYRHHLGVIPHDEPAAARDEEMHHRPAA